MKEKFCNGVSRISFNCSARVQFKKFFIIKGDVPDDVKFICYNTQYVNFLINFTILCSTIKYLGLKARMEK